MDDLNHYALSRALGSEVRPIEVGRFSNFGLLKTTAEILKAQTTAGQHNDGSLDEDRLVVQAFENVRHGAAPDRILWDKNLSQQFEQRCRELGLTAPTATLGKRLLNVRKNSRRYAKHGIRISRTTATEPQASVVPQHAHAIEFALVRLRYRYGASIDEILLDPELARRFEELALAMAPGLSASEVRLGALYIRKTRHVKKKERPVVESLCPTDIEVEWSNPISLSAAPTGDVPSSPGLVEVNEGNRCLYVSRTSDVAPTVREFCVGRPFDLLAGPFWTPERAHIAVRFITGNLIHGATAHRWELRLIANNEPVFNWPVREAA